MADHHLLRSRTGPRSTPAPAPGPTSAPSELETQIEFATLVAAAGDVIPHAYRGKPGAVLVAMQWAEARGVDLLTTLQSVSFYAGRAVIDATMQRALAIRAGYRLEVEAGAGEATVTITRDGTSRSATYTLADAETARLLSKDNWRKNPEDMLVARATSRAMRRHAPDVMVGVYSADELEDDDTDELADLQQRVDELECTDDTFAALVAHRAELDEGDAEMLDTWIESQGWQLQASKLTEVQGQAILAWQPR